MNRYNVIYCGDQTPSIGSSASQRFSTAAAQIFLGGDFYVTNEPPAVAAFLSLWAIPLMFLIAGMTIRYPLLKRSAKEFLIERIGRLLVPFVTGILVVLPPQTYCWLKSNPGYDQSFLQFSPRFFNVRFACRDGTWVPLQPHFYYTKSVCGELR